MADQQQHQMQQMIEEQNRSEDSADFQDFQSYQNESSVTSLCTKDQNIEDALENMQNLQDHTVDSNLMQRGNTKMGDDGDGANAQLMDINVLKGPQDYDEAEILEKRFAELIPAEKVVYHLSKINEQVTNIDNLVQKVCADSEQDFLNAYTGHMGMIMRELKSFRNKINSQKFEMKKNKQIKNLQAEVDYFQEEALHYRKVDELNSDHITEVHTEMVGLRDDTYVLRKALLNTKTKQKSLEKQLETTKNDNLELMTKVQSLQTQLRVQMISYQKNQLIQTALNVDYITPAILSEQEWQNLAPSEKSSRIANIKVSDGQQHGQNETNVTTLNSVHRGGGIISINKNYSLNDTVTSQGGTTSAGDEQGIRAFLFKLINSRHIFSNNDIVDQIEAFVQIKMDKCNQMIASFRDRLSKSEKETRRVTLENKKLSSEQFNVTKVFKECLEQLKVDKRRNEHQLAYQNANLVDSAKRQTGTDTLNQSIASGGGHHTQKRVTKRIQSGHARKFSGATTSNTSRLATSKGLTQRHSQPSKGIFVIKSKIGQQSQRERRSIAAPVEPIDEHGNLQNEDISFAQTGRRNRNTTQGARAFQTLDDATVPLCGPSPDQIVMQQTLGSPQLFSEREFGTSTNLSSEHMAAQQKRAIIDNFLKDEHVFQLLYDTVFASPLETLQAQETRTLKTNKQGQFDLDGHELPKNFVKIVSEANEQLFEAVVQGTDLPPNLASSQNKSRTHKRNQSQSLGIRGHRPTGSFFQSGDPNSQPSNALAIFEGLDQNIDSAMDQNNRNNSSQTFFVTLQDAAVKKPENNSIAKQGRSPNSQNNESAANTLRGSQDLDSPNAQAVLALEARKSTDHQSKEHDDEVNMLFDEDVVNPLTQAASNAASGNLNVQTLIEQSKNMAGQGRAGKPVRPQSSRPMFRSNFQTLDPSSQRLGGRVAAYSKELNFQSGGNIHSIQEDSHHKIKQDTPTNLPEHQQLVANNYESNMNLQGQAAANEPKSAMQRRPVPGPSLMMKDRSDFIYHMLELETRGRISQKAVNQKHLSPRSSRLLASRHFMNRNSTAGSSGFGNHQKRGSEGSSLIPQALLADPGFAGGTLIGKTRPMSSKVPKAPQQVNTRFKLQRQRLGSAKIRSNLQRNGMFQGTAPPQEQLAQYNTRAEGEGTKVMNPAILSATSSNTFFNQTQR